MFALVSTVASAALTLVLASQANLIWEEAHYRLAGRQLDWGYPDTPIGAPLVNALSEHLFGTGRLGSRLVIWLLSAMLPLAAYFAALPLVPRLQALQAALAAALIPPFLIAGVYAYPEGPLQLITLVFLACLLRALQRDSWRFWLAAGAVCALGAMYYYRFWFIPFGVAVFLIADRGGRALWRNPRAWAAGGLAALGLLPSLIDNILKEFGPILFQLSGRQDWAFWPRAALYPFEQAGLVSPVVFILLVLAAGIAWQRGRTGDTGSALIFCIATANFLPFFVLAFFDMDYLPHWPFLAYVPLVILLPAAFDALASRMRFSWARPAVFGLAAVLAIGTTGVMSSTILMWRHPDVFLSEAGQARLTGGDLEDWSVLQQPLARARAHAGPGSVLAAGDHILAVQLQIAAQAEGPVYVLDHPEDRSRNYQGYRLLRGEGEADLQAEEAGAPAVIILREPPYLYRAAERVALRARMCRLFEAVDHIETVGLTPGRVQASIFSGRVREAPASEASPGGCAFFPQGVIERPVAGQSVSGEIIIHGAAAHPDGAQAVEIRLDGEVIARDGSLIDLPGYRFPQELDFDPTYPGVYWDVRADISDIAPGRHILSLIVITQAGEHVEADQRPIYVR